MKKFFCFLFFCFLFFCFTTSASSSDFNLTENMKKKIFCRFQKNSSSLFKILSVRNDPIEFFCERNGCFIYLIPFKVVETGTTYPYRISFAVFFQKRNGDWKFLSLQRKEQILDRFSKNLFERADLEDLLDDNAGY